MVGASCFRGFLGLGSFRASGPLCQGILDPAELTVTVVAVFQSRLNLPQRLDIGLGPGVGKSHTLPIGP